MRRELTVRIEHDHERDAPEIVSFGNYLGADEYVDFAGMYGVERFWRHPAAVSNRRSTRAIRLPATSVERFFDALRSVTDAFHMLIAARRARTRDLGAYPQ